MKKSIQPPHLKDQKMSRRKKIGLPPGTLMYVGDKENEGNFRIELYSYNELECSKQVFASAQEAIAAIPSSMNVWINVIGLSNIREIEAFCRYAQIHDLFIEDILDTQHRPKIEVFEHSILEIIKMLHIKNSKVIIEHLGLILGKNFLISFQEEDGDVFDGIRKRIQEKNSLLRRKKIDFLFFSIMDAIVDNYFVVLENITERVEAFEDRIINTPEEKMIGEIQDMKREANLIRRSVYPLREVINKLHRSHYPVIDESTHKYFGDLSEHSVHITESLDSYQDILLGLMDMYMSSMGNRMNNIMKILTIMSTIFIPITFIAGVYGMNFENMPFLKNPNGYYITWGVMFVIAFLMLLFYKKKRWI